MAELLAEMECYILRRCPAGLTIPKEVGLLGLKKWLSFNVLMYHDMKPTRNPADLITACPPLVSRAGIYAINDLLATLRGDDSEITVLLKGTRDEIARRYPNSLGTV